MIRFVPNALSVLRILCIPWILLGLYLGSYYYPYVFYLFLIAAMSDWLDGMIARRYNVLTELGAWLDPIADKLLVLAVLLALSTMTESTFLWVCNILLILRNVVMNLIRSMCDYLSMSNVVKVSVLGKTKTVFEFFYIAFSLFFLAYSKYKL